MAAKFRQLGCVCVAPTPFAHASADEGRSDRRAVGPMKTMRTTASVDPGDDGAFGSSQPKTATKLAAAVATAHVRTLQDTGKSCGFLNLQPLVVNQYLATDSQPRDKRAVELTRNRALEIEAFSSSRWVEFVLLVSNRRDVLSSVASVRYDISLVRLLGPLVPIPHHRCAFLHHGDHK
jgi:hypothetical protein